MSERKKIGIIGGGIAGLSAAWMLNNHDVTVFEKKDRLGGHAHTVNAKINDHLTVPVDVGAQFFFDALHPLFKRLVLILSKASGKDMIHNIDLSITLHNTDTKKTFIMSLSSWTKVLRNIWNIPTLLRLRFVLGSAKDIIYAREWGMTTEEYLAQLDYPEGFKQNFLRPLLYSIWTEGAQTGSTAALATLYFTAFGQPQNILANDDFGVWIIKDGTQEYIKVLANLIENNDEASGQIHINADVQSIVQENDQWIVTTEDGEHTFDHLIMATQATHAKAALSGLADDPRFTDIYALISAVKYVQSRVVVHSDSKHFLLPNPKDWSFTNLEWNGESHNYISILANKEYPDRQYPVELLKTWTTNWRREPETQYGGDHFHHVHLLPETFYQQYQLKALQGQHNLWFVGGWTRQVDSHENAILSSIDVVTRIGAGSNMHELVGRNHPIT